STLELSPQARARERAGRAGVSRTHGSHPRDLHPPRSSLPVRRPAVWAWVALKKRSSSSQFRLSVPEDEQVNGNEGREGVTFGSPSRALAAEMRTARASRRG